MRNLTALLLIVLIGACAPCKNESVSHLYPAEIRNNLLDFYEQMYLANYDKAKDIAQERNVDPELVRAAVRVAMARAVYDLRDPSRAKNIADKFELDPAGQQDFARDALNYLLRSEQCQLAAEVAEAFNFYY